MTDTYKQAIRRAAEAVCWKLLGLPASDHYDRAEEVLNQNITHPHSPYECYWRDRALAAEKALGQVDYELEKIEQTRWGWDGDCGVLFNVNAAREIIEDATKK